MFKGKMNKAWMGLFMPVVMTAIFGGVEAMGFPLDPMVKTGILAILTGLGVYQIPNRV